MWLELSARIGGGRELGIVLIGYTLLTLVGMAWYGKHRWRTHGEVFSVWFGLLGRLAPYGLVGRRRDGQVRRRGFGQRADASAVVGLPAGGGSGWRPARSSGTASRRRSRSTTSWATRTRSLDTLMLLRLPRLHDRRRCIAVGRRVGYAAMGAGLVPVAVGYIVAHYLTYLLTEGQRIVVALSDPLQQGWDLLGTVALRAAR